MQLIGGGYSQIKSFLYILEKALSIGTYRYFHWISGADLPLHNQNYIHNFFDKYDGYEFLAFVGEKVYDKVNPIDRLKYYYPFQETRFSRGRLRNYFLKIQKLIGVNRIGQLNNMRIGYGTNWCSITNDFGNYIISQKKLIRKLFKETSCCDELFIHTLALNSNFKDKIFVKEGLNDLESDRQGSLRYINWWDGNPKCWTFEDKDELVRAKDRGYLFSRKFDERLDKDIINFIGNLVKNENECSITDHL